MNNYRKVIKQRMLWKGAFCALIAVLAVADQLGWLNTYGVMSSFQMGFLVGLMVVTVLNMWQMNQALNNDQQLKKLYTIEHDERLMMIRQKAGVPMLTITSCLMIFVGIIAGYVNQLVFITLITAAVAQLIISLLVKLYYTKQI